MFMFKTLTLEHLSVYKRMTELNTLRLNQATMLRQLEDTKRIANYKLKFEVEEIVNMQHMDEQEQLTSKVSLF